MREWLPSLFKYARQEFGLDGLPEHLLEPVDPAEQVVNPRWRLLDRLLKRARTQRARRRDQQALADRQARQLRGQSRARKGGAADRLRKRADQWRATARQCGQEAAQLHQTVAELAAQRRATPKHIAVGDLPEGQRYQVVAEPLRQLLLLKMIAYRAETAMLVAGLNGSDGKPLPRGLVQGLLKTPAHLEPDPEVRVLRVRLLHQSTAAADRRLEPLLDALNASRTVYPGTDLRLVYEFTA